MRWPLLFIFVLLAAAASADQFTNMEYYAKAGVPMCYSNGQIVLPFTQFKGSVALPGLIKDIAVQDDEDHFTKIFGNFYSTGYKPIGVSGIGETVLFVSEENLFPRNMNYTVVLAGVFAELIPVYEDVSLVKYNFECPGFLHYCSKVNLSIDNCTIDREYLDITYHGIHLSESTKVNVTRDVEFSLNQELYQSDTDTIPMPVTRQYLRWGPDLFVLRIPVEDLLGQVTSVTAHLTGCNDDLHDVIATKKCIVKRPRNVTVLQTDKVEYTCKTTSDSQKVAPVCNQIVALPAGMSASKYATPSANLIVFEFLKRIVRLAIRMPSLA